MLFPPHIQVNTCSHEKITNFCFQVDDTQYTVAQVPLICLHPANLFTWIPLYLCWRLCYMQNWAHP